VPAVMYFQRNTLADPYDESDVEWLKGYAQAVGRTFALHFAHRRAEREMGGVADDGEVESPGDEIVGGSPQMRRLRREIRDVHAPALGSEHPDPILIVGERGTGKDLVARCLHSRSSRSKRPFVAVNCAEIGDELAAARFFGHRRGSFTGALTDEPGYFRSAQGGVLFLDEIGDLSPRAQGCLLRVLENRVVGPVGETREIPVDVAVVMATNRDLDDAIAKGTLRADFYDRFRTHVIRLAPLRERPWDVFPLLEHFRLHHERRLRKPTLGFSDQVFRSMVAYPWPGNVRELARTCSLLITHAKEGSLLESELLAGCSPEIATSAPNPRALFTDPDISMRDALRLFRRELVQRRLELHGGDVNATRKSLGLPRSTFHRYAKLLGLEVAAPRREH
jgi:DNA-binding NtrC family response regulator